MAKVDAAMNYQIKKEQYMRFPILVLLVFYLLFTIADLSTSFQSGFRDADRSSVHKYLIIVTGYLLVYTVFNLKNLKIRQPLGSLFVIAVWTMFINLSFGVSIWGFLVQANMSVLWVLSYMFFERIRLKESMDYSSINLFSYILFIFYAISTIYYFFDMMVRMNRIPVLNVIYYFISLLPWIMIKTPSKFKKFIFIASLIVVLFSMKRGAIIALPLMILADSFVEIRKHGSTKRFFKIIAFITVFIIALLIADKLSNGFISERFSADDLASGSGRSEQFTTVLDIIKNRNLFEFIFGCGSENVVKILGTGVHNEWLSFLFSYGLIGFLLYTGLVIGFVKKSLVVLKVCPDLASPCFMMTILYLVLSMVSTGYGGYVGFWLFGFWGYLNAEIDMRSNTNAVNGGNVNEVV